MTFKDIFDCLYCSCEVLRKLMMIGLRYLIAILQTDVSAVSGCGHLQRVIGLDSQDMDISHEAPLHHSIMSLNTYAKL